MSNRTAPAPFTARDAVDRFISTVGLALFALGMLAALYHYSPVLIDAGMFIVHTVRVIGYTIVDAVTTVAQFLKRLTM